MDRFFSKFPLMVYNGSTCRDISRSVRFDNPSKHQATLYYPIEIDAGFRSDNLADAYYDDAERDWMIWLANDIVDPYYEWYLSEQEFDSFIKEKYGSYEASVKQIKCYRNNWYKLEETIAPSYYDNNLTGELKKYYTATFGVGNKITQYIRKQEDWLVNTNRIINYQISSNTAFQTNEIIDIKTGGEIVGGGTVVFSNTTLVTIQHVSGNTTANSTSTKEIIGETSKVSAITSNSTISQINLTDYESIYWEPVTWYDYEQEQNEKRKNLYVINTEYADDISNQIRIKLKE